MAESKITTNRKCPGCGQIKSRSEFYLSPRGTITYAKCKKCHNYLRRKIYNDPVLGSELRERNRIRYENDKYNILESSKPRKAKWAKDNPDKVRAAFIRWYSQESNRKIANIRVSKFKKDNPEKNRHDNRARRARRAEVGGILSKDIEERLFLLQRGKCACCASDLKKTGQHLDHIVAISKGGMNIDANVQLLCPRCNGQKHAKDPIKFMQSKGFLL